MSIPPIKQPTKSPAAENPVAARKQDPSALRNKALNILHSKSSKVDAKALVQRVMSDDLFDSFNPTEFRSKIK